jgi:hypothetical protein
MKSPPPSRTDRLPPVRRTPRALGRAARPRASSDRHDPGHRGNAVLLIHDGYGHLSPSDPSACVSQTLGSYFVDLTTPPRGTICPSDHLPFDSNFGQPTPSP